METACRSTATSTIALIFLVVFVILVLFDSIMTAYALKISLEKDGETCKTLKRDIEEKSKQLEILNRQIEKRQRVSFEL